MELIAKSDTPTINAEDIQKGDLIRAKYSAWPEERNGQVAAVTRDEIRVIWQPNIRNVTNFFSIMADELADGLWAVKWTPDMETFSVYPVPEEPVEPVDPPPLAPVDPIGPAGPVDVGDSDGGTGE